MDPWLEVLYERERRTNADEAMIQGLKQCSSRLLG
jgi:hypothetical protein